MKITIAAMIAALVLTLSACEREKGPAEKLGEKIDESVEKITHGDEGALEKAGREADEAIDDAKKKLEDDD